MKSNFHLILKRLGGATHVVLTSVILVLLGSSPAFADDTFAGQPYFSLSGMLVSAGDAEISSANGTNNPLFIPGAEIKTNTGFGVVGAYGWLFDSNWRTEIELGYREVGLDSIDSQAGGAALDGDLGILAGFVNVVRDFRGESFITPYAGLGIGGAYQKMKVDSIGGSPPDFFGVRETWSLAYQAMVGLTFEVGDDMDIYTGYRFMGVWKPDYDAFELERMDTHNFEFGVRFYVGD